MPSRVNFPRYAIRVQERYRLVNTEELSDAAFGKQYDLSGYQIGRWLKTLPESYERCRRWAEILRAPVAWLFIEESDLGPLVEWFKRGRPLLPPPKRRRASSSDAQGDGAEGRPEVRRAKGQPS